MIKTLSLTNFRRHQSLRQNFENGLNVIRASNEFGKTTVLEAITYCLFGSKALRTSLDEAVTWGKPVSSLKVELTVDIAGTDLVFKRGKSGAEVLRDGQTFVTGQAEVSGYAATLFGVDLNAAARLMMASQNGLRGSLEQGPKATAEMIESLADFDLFERILEEAQAKLALGPTAILEAAIERLTSTMPEVDAEPDTSTTATKISQLQAIRERTAQASQEAMFKVAETRAQLLQVERHNEAVTAAGRRLSDALARVANLTKDRAATAAKIVLVSDDELEVLRRSMVTASDHAQRYSAYKKLADYTFPEGNFWEGDEASFTAEVKRAIAEKSRIEREMSQTEADIRVLESKRTTASVCGFCNQDVSQFPEVARRNAELETEIAVRTADLAALRAQHKEARDLILALDEVSADVSKQRNLLAGIEQYVYLGTDTWPARITWRGEVPQPGGDDVAALKAELDRLTAIKMATAAASGQLAQLEQQIAEAEADAARYEQEAKEVGPKKSTDELRAALVDDENAEARADAEVSELDKVISDLRIEVVRIEQEHKAAVAARAKAEADLGRTRVELSDLTFNNALVKKVRSARPIISDKLWNTVLAAVSSMFTRMRGETSVVAKGKDGFTVNGQTVTSLSGSTLDLLGLAIRVALTKTFLPQCPLLILDEPFAACDDDRSAAMLGFIQASGFSQIILVTHEDASESVADHLITLETV